MSNVSLWCKERRRPITIALCIYCLLMTLIVLWNAVTLDDLYTNRSLQSTVLNDGWAVYEGDKLVGEEVTLPYHPSSDKVDRLIIQQKLPDTSYHSTALVASVYQVVLTVELEGKTLYQTPYRETRINRTPGSEQVIVPLPEGYEGKQLVLTYDRVVRTDPTGATGVRLIDLSTLRALSVVSNSPLFFTMCALAIVGMVLLVLAILYDRARLLLCPLFYLAAFTIITPVWVLCNTKLIQFFIGNLVLIHNLEYITFFLFPLSMWAFLHTNWGSHPRTTQLGIDLMTTFYTLAITLKVAGIADFQVLISLYHLLLLGLVALFVVSAMHGLRGKDVSLKLFFAGFIILALAGLGDLAIFYLLPGKQPLLILWGIIAMGLCLIMSYLLSAKTRLEEHVEDNIYKTLAYTDKLTGLPNRLTFEEDVERLSGELSRHRSIIFINTDVNRFKHINDTYGHMMGDHVLREVATVLHRSFDGICKCYRMGGDEFCLIAIDQDPRQLDALLGRVNGELDRIVVEFSVSIAHGMTEYNSFLHHGLMDVFKSADDMMYEHKRTHR